MLYDGARNELGMLSEGGSWSQWGLKWRGLPSCMSPGCSLLGESVLRASIQLLNTSAGRTVLLFDALSGHWLLEGWQKHGLKVVKSAVM